MYEGVSDALHALKERQVVMGVCTSKRTDFAVRILEMFNIASLFLFVKALTSAFRRGEFCEGLRNGASGESRYHGWRPPS